MSRLLTYQPLKDHLSRATARKLLMTYSEIETVLGRKLPDTAYGDHIRQWWANTTSHSQGRAWLEAGWRAQVDVSRKRVLFTTDDERRSNATTPAPTDVLLRRPDLSRTAIRMIEDFAEERGDGDLSAAVGELLNRAALERRKQLLGWFAAHSPSTASDSAELIREDRDAR